MKVKKFSAIDRKNAINLSSRGQVISILTNVLFFSILGFIISCTLHSITIDITILIILIGALIGAILSFNSLFILKPSVLGIKPTMQELKYHYRQNELKSNPTSAFRRIMANTFSQLCKPKDDRKTLLHWLNKAEK